MALLPPRLAEGTLGTGAAPLYTAPTSPPRQANVVLAIFTNLDGAADRTLDYWDGTATDGRALIRSGVLTPNGRAVNDDVILLAPGQSVLGRADVAGMVSFQIRGTEGIG